MLCDIGFEIPADQLVDMKPPYAARMFLPIQQKPPPIYGPTRATVPPK